MKSFVEHYLKEYVNHPIIIIDVGSQAVGGHPTYIPFFDNPHWKYLWLDFLKGEKVDIVVKDPYKWEEVEDASVDVVISGQAFEHIEFPWLTIKEIFRILKDKGIACIIAPSGGPEHRHPVDCWRIFPDGMRALAKWAGFRVVEVFTDWELDPWRDTFAVFQKPLTGSEKTSPFEDFSNKEVALKVYLEAFKDKPQNPAYYVRASNILKAKGEIKKAQSYMATALAMFPHNLWLRQRATELYIETEPLLALEHAIYLLRARPINADNVRILGRFLEKLDEERKTFLFEQLPNDIPSLRQFAYLSEKEKVYMLAEECWRRISGLQPEDLNAKLMHALMPRGYENKELSEKRFTELLEYQISKGVLNRTTIIQPFN
ncbi:MAG: methyltransferase domain-containing protein [Caldimicrobium sp.]|nr:methyltransferase domain-containing protein [Caldimicrobium sp.]